jgi:uncharacterized protein with PIN domain
MQSCPPVSCAGGEAPRFLADAMLGRLARWLRILGYDAEYFPGEDDDLLRLARRENRVLLTRDTRLLRRRPLPPHLFIQSDRVMEQLRQVVAALRLDPTASPAHRCVCCNTVLEQRPKAAVFGLVPEFVWSHHERFWGCPGCRRVYWAGSHRQRMEEAIRSLGQ